MNGGCAVILMPDGMVGRRYDMAAAMQHPQHNPPALIRGIYTTIRTAREAGLDRHSQERRAVEAVRIIRPDIAEMDAMNMVWRVRPD